MGDLVSCCAQGLALKDFVGGDSDINRVTVEYSLNFSICVKRKLLHYHVRIRLFLCSEELTLR